MYSGLLEKSQLSVEAVRRHIDASSAIRSLIVERRLRCVNATPCFDLGPFYDKTPSSIEWRVIDHCSAVTRLYAIYEQFVQDLLRSYLTFLESCVPYPSLDPVLRAEHRRTLGLVLSNMGKERYQGLNFESIIDDLTTAFLPGGAYRLLPEAMLSHEQNLRMPELGMLFSRCGIPDIAAWSSKHPAIRSFFATEKRQSDKADAELKQLVDYRNDAAHGGISVDAVLGPDILMEFADFLVVFFIALSERAQWSLIQTSLDHQKIRLAGIINEVFSGNIGVANVENATFAIGDLIYLRGANYCYEATILSLQENDVDVESSRVLKPIELGFRFDRPIRKGAEIYYVKIEPTVSGSAPAEPPISQMGLDA
jgi:RiboL-PSP-HEPN